MLLRTCIMYQYAIFYTRNMTINLSHRHSSQHSNQLYKTQQNKIYTKITNFKCHPYYINSNIN